MPQPHDADPTTPAGRASHRWTRVPDGDRVDELLAGLELRPLADVIGRGRWVRGLPGRRIARKVAAEVEHGFAWFGMRSITERWYPQGIDMVPRSLTNGARVLAVTWFRQTRARANIGSRVTLVALEGRRRRVDVQLVVAGDDGFEPAAMHAGGIAWIGSRLHVAASSHGIWEFDVADLSWDRRERAFVLPRRAVLRAKEKAGRVKISFVGREHDEPSTLLVGEFAAGEHGRLGRLVLDDDGATLVTELPGIPRMQGVVGLADGRRAVTSSNDAKTKGDLWISASGDTSASPFERRTGALLPGPEDAAYDDEAGVLWTLSEHPFKRFVYAVRLPPAER